MLLLSDPPPDRHTLAEDVQGMLIGCTLVALSIQFLRASELITGQIAGLSLVVAYPTGWSFGVVFFVLNMPFYVLAIRQMGWRFTVKNFIAVTTMSVMAELMPFVVQVQPLHPAVGAGLFGLCAGMGLLGLFRHGASLGGVGIVALWLQDTRGIKAGNTQLHLRSGCLHARAVSLPVGKGPVVAAGRGDPERDHHDQPPARPLHRQTLGLGRVVEPVIERALPRPFGVVILPLGDGPDERTEPQKPEPHGNRDQEDEHVHFCPLMALSDTVTDDVDIAIAARSGVAKPASATGTEMTL